MRSLTIVETRHPRANVEETGCPETSSAGAPKLASAGLNFYYGTNHVLHDISLSIQANKITAFIGPSGCGKSTFLRSFNRMNDHIRNARLEGQVLLDSADVRTLEVSALRRRVGMVFQRSNPFPKSIFDNVAYGPRVNGIRRKRKLEEAVERSLRRSALWEDVKDKLHKSAFELSGGQQPRLCIARALAVDPEVLLLDEPCSALDPVATAKIEDLLFVLKKSCTVVIVTHNLQQGARVADYTGFFLMGKLIEFDKANVIFERPKVKATEDYITGRFG